MKILILGGSGFVPPEDPAVLIAALKRISLIFREELQAIGVRARQITEQCFTPEKILSE